MAEWINHAGGPMPRIEGLRCDIRFRNGLVFENENSQDWQYDWEWADREPADDNIVAYRVRRAADDH